MADESTVVELSPVAGRAGPEGSLAPAAPPGYDPAPAERFRAPSWRYPWWLRVLMVLLGGGLMALLATAATLQPDVKRGYGTHQQLGLPPCSFQTMFGLRCPSCGMTTSWAHLMRGQVVSALRANTGGTLLGLVSLVFGPWTAASGLRGRWIGRSLRETHAAGLAILVMGVTLTDWIVRNFVLQ